jgi:RNA polymerase sigma-70 factor (ECF subfamily)
MSDSGLEAIFLANRDKLLGFLRAHGAADAAEDLLQELWLKIEGSATGPIASPLSYLYRAANNLILDRHRATSRAAKRDVEYSEAATTIPGRSDAPSPERKLIARQQVRQANAALDALGERTAMVFRRYRLEGKQQRDIAAELGISLSTVESDLRKAYAAMIALRKSFDDA